MLNENLKKYRRRGLTVVHIVLIIAVILALGGGGILAVSKKVKEPSQEIAPSTTNNQEVQRKESTEEIAFNWQMSEKGWQATASPPSCPSPMVFQPPADLTKATAILYPGQTRGGNYKPHGGFRFDNQTDNNLKVVAPLTAYAVSGGRYLVDGETQYTFDFIHPCGYMYRVGHFLKLPANLAKIADNFPPAKEGDSRTEFINPPVLVKEGEQIATAVGVTKDRNVFFDFGVYNLLEKNQASKDAKWAASHDPQLATSAVCWFNLLPANAQTIVKSLPAGDPASGKSSDYC